MVLFGVGGGGGGVCRGSNQRSDVMQVRTFYLTGTCSSAGIPSLQSHNQTRIAGKVSAVSSSSLQLTKPALGSPSFIRSAKVAPAYKPSPSSLAGRSTALAPKRKPFKAPRPAGSIPKEEEQASLRNILQRFSRPCGSKKAVDPPPLLPLSPLPPLSSPRPLAPPPPPSRF